MSELGEWLTRDEAAILRGWFEDCGDCRSDEERDKRCKMRGWSMGKRRVVEGIMARLRGQGVYVSGLDSVGRWIIGQRLGNRVDRELSERAEEFEAKGRDIVERYGLGGGCVRRLEGE